MTTHRPDDYHFDPRSREHAIDPEEALDTDPRRDEFRRWRHATLDSLSRAKSQLLCLCDVCDSYAVREALADLNALTSWTENLRLSYDAGLEAGTVQEAAMKLIVLVVRNEAHPDESWVETAWDEYTLDADATPYFDAVKKAVAKHGHQNVGEIEVVVPDDSLSKAFPPIPKVAGEVVKGGPCEQDEEGK